MPVIPRKTKIKNKEFGIFDFETFAILVTVLFVTAQFLVNLVHARLKLPAVIFVLILSSYCLFDTPKNKGKKGYQRIVLWLRYALWKLPERKFKR